MKTIRAKEGKYLTDGSVYVTEVSVRDDEAYKLIRWRETEDTEPLLDDSQAIEMLVAALGK